MKRIARTKKTYDIAPRASVRTISPKSVPGTKVSYSRQAEVDYGSAVTSHALPLPPPYRLEKIDECYEISNILRQCIEAYVVNIGQAGWDIVQAKESVPIDDEEKELLESFIESANSSQSLTSVHAGVVQYYERRGFSFLEICRDRAGRISLFRNITTRSFYVLPKGEEVIPVTYDISRGRRVSNVTELRRFRKYVQVEGGTHVFFKEFGDPRRMSHVTGQYESADYKIEEQDLASEVYHFRQDSSDPYGVPRWIAQITSIMGSREAEEVNLEYFKENTIPPMAISVTGGRLTGESYKELRSIVDSSGRAKQHRVLLLEAVSTNDSLDESNSPIGFKIDKLADTRQSDGLFQKYDEANQSKIRSSFRLSPVSIGMAENLNYAVANVASFIVESQVYAPERKKYDEIYNKNFVNGPYGLNLKTVKLQSQVPAITNPAELIKALTALNVMGALTPRRAIETANKILQIEIPPYPKNEEEGYEDWMDMPIQLALRKVGGTGFGDVPDNTQDEQSVKDTGIKETEDDGDVQLKMPEHGQE